MKLKIGKKSGLDKAANAIAAVRSDLEARGFTVTMARDVSANGADLHAIRGDFGARVEVKAAFFSGRAWRIKAVKRPQDDFLAVVFPNGAIHYEPMEHHRLVAGSKDRAVTQIGRIHGA